MNSLLNFLLRVVLSVGRSDDDRVSLLGDLEEEHRARLARGSGATRGLRVVRGRDLSCTWSGDCVTPSCVAPRTCAQTTAARMVMFSWPDIKLSLRLLIRNPGLTVVSSVGIAVGIAITAGMFGFFHAIFAPTLPLDEGDRIVALENWDVAKNNENRQSLHDFVTWRDQMTSVVEISAFRTIAATMQTGDRLPETVRVAAMSAERVPGGARARAARTVSHARR